MVLATQVRLEHLVLKVYRDQLEHLCRVLPEYKVLLVCKDLRALKVYRGLLVCKALQVFKAYKDLLALQVLKGYQDPLERR